MTISTTIKVLMTSLETAKNKEKRNTLLIAILIPFGIIAFFFSIFVYKSTDYENDVYLISAQEVATEQQTVNKLDGNLVRSIYFLYENKQTEEKSEIKAFIEKFFVRKVSETIIVDNEEIEVTYNAFKSYLEIQNMLLQSPFNFDKDTMSLVNLYLLTSPNKNNSNDNNGYNPDILPFRLISPCEGYVSSYYGIRKHPVTNEPLSLHTGIDIVGNHHQSICSVANGEVVEINTKTNGYGNYIKIKHSINEITFYSFYAHLSSINVKVGQVVSEGDIIGLEGGDQSDNNPGVSTGHHLHFEIRTAPSRNSCIDPAPYIGK